MEHAGNCSVSCICQCSTVILLNKTFLHTNIIISLLPFYKVCVTKIGLESLKYQFLSCTVLHMQRSCKKLGLIKVIISFSNCKWSVCPKITIQIWS